MQRYTDELAGDQYVRSKTNMKMPTWQVLLYLRNTMLICNAFKLRLLDKNPIYYKGMRSRDIGGMLAT
eukprot:m.981128 g.981128  ORF g.981128 m.981128 type:complete len:68 (+) comp23971_c0_seq13:3846-4049(+)